MDKRYQQLADLLKLKGIHNEQVLAAIANTPRHVFMPEDIRQYAADDNALPIGEQQTISQPFVVARMTEALLESGPLNKVLEIGTGSGYQAAILSYVTKEVFTVERIEKLLIKAMLCFDELGLENIKTLYADGRLGWQEHAPYDGIIVTAATDEVPPALLEQLADQGRLIIPLGSRLGQELRLFKRDGEDYKTTRLDPVMFVPLRHGKE